MKKQSNSKEDAVHCSTRLFKIPLVIALALLVFVYSAPASDDNETATNEAPDVQQIDEKEASKIFRKMYLSLMPKMKEIREREDHDSSLPESKWFGEDRQSNRETINELLDESIEILNASTVHNDRIEIRELQAEIRESDQKIAKLREQEIGADSKDDIGWIRSLNPLKKTREYYQAKIEKEENRKQEYMDEMAASQKWWKKVSACPILVVEKQNT